MNYLTLSQQACQEAGQGEGPTAVTGQTGINQRFLIWVRRAWTDIQESLENWKFAWSQTSFVTALDGGGVNYLSVKDMDTSTFKSFDHETWSIYKTVEGEHESYQMFYVDYQEFKLSHLNSGEPDPGQPSIITIRPDGDLEYYPQPDDDYTITVNGYLKTQLLSSTGDEPRLKDEGLQRAIIARALMYYARWDNAPEVYAGAKEEYIDLYDVIVDNYEDRPYPLDVVAS